MLSKILYIFCIEFGIVISICSANAPSKMEPYAIAVNDLPAIGANDKNIEINAYKFLGAWGVPAKTKWEDVAQLSFEKNALSVSLKPSETLLDGAFQMVIKTNAEDVSYKSVKWEGEQVSLLAFCAKVENTMTAVFKFETDSQIVIYYNGKVIKKITETSNIDYGIQFYVPIQLHKGENILTVKALSIKGPPRLRISAAFDGASDFQAAWNTNESLLAKKIIYIDEHGNAPELKWDPLLNNLRMSVEVFDVVGNKIVVKKDNMQSGSILRDGPKGLEPGIYKVTYRSKQETASEYFIIGAPKPTFDNLKNEFASLNIPTNEIQLNIEAQIKRGEILFSRGNYDAESTVWQEKVLYTLDRLVSMITMLRNAKQTVSKDIPGLHIRGFRSITDASTQYYRIFIPSTYNPEQGVPLLLIMPTPFSAKQKSFIESPFMEAHREASRISKFAEKYGFGVLWPGYRNAPEGWAYESAYVNEVIKAVEGDYNIEQSKISIYGACGGGFFAGRLAAIYPYRFASIIYDRAIFDKEITSKQDSSLISWREATNPTTAIINNSRIKIFVLNDGSRPAGHGEIELSERFLEKAKERRTDIREHLGPYQAGTPLWDMVFDWLGTCANKEYDRHQSDYLKEVGYEGPIAEIFSTPFIIVKGTNMDSKKAQNQMELLIEHIKATYSRQFYGVLPVVKNDRDVTPQELKDYSLILVGNPECNIIWDKLERHLPVNMTASGLTIKDHQFLSDSAFVSIFKHPLNSGRIVTVGAFDLNRLPLTSMVNLCRAWYDCRVFELSNKSSRTHTIPKLNTTDK